MTPADPGAWERLGAQLHDAARAARQVADGREPAPPAGDQRHRGVSGVNQDRALEALRLAWGDAYDISFGDGRWTAVSRGAAQRAVTGDTPDALTVKIRADWARAAIPPPRTGR